MTTSLSSSSPVVSIASSSSSAAAGGSVINVSSLVSQLVTATFAGQQANLTEQTTAVASEISAAGTLKSALSTFQSALSSLSTPAAFNALTASSSDQSVFTATTAAGAVAGSYNVSVTQLAQAQQLVSNPFTAGANATIGTGTLSIGLGTQSFSVTIDSTNNTLEGIASAINSASGNPGVTATVVQGTDGAHLVLGSTLTGTGNTLTVSASGGDGNLAPLDYSSTQTSNYTQAQAPQDAIVSIAGISYQSASNTVTDALTGVTLNLVSKSPSGASETLNVSNDTSTIASNISNFVSAYNTLIGTFNTLGGYDSTSGTAGPMAGSPVLSGIENQINNVVHGLISGSSSYNSLASIGVTTQSDGTLTLNSSTLNSALASNFTAISQLFSGANGVATQLNTQLTNDLAANSGPVASYTQMLTQQNSALTKQSQSLQSQESALTASMTQEFASLNTLLSSLQTTSAYLSQAFAKLPGAASSSSNSG